MSLVTPRPNIRKHSRKHSGNANAIGVVHRTSLQGNHTARSRLRRNSSPHEDVHSVQCTARLVPKADELLHLLQDGEKAVKCNFVGTAMELDIVQAVANFLRGRSCQLHHFELKNVHLGIDAVRLLANGLRENLSLTYLGLERTSLNGRAASAHVAEILRARGNKIAHLNLSRNSLGDAGVAVIAEALWSNNSLRNLNLHSCGIGNEGGRQVAEALRKNRALQILDLASNNLTEVGCELAQVLPLSRVRTIDVCYNNMPPEALLAIEAAKTYPSQVWGSSDMSVVFQTSRCWSESFPADIWKVLRVGETMRTYLEAIDQLWKEHVKAEEVIGKSWDLLASLYAPLVVCPDADGFGFHFDPERLRRLAHMCLPHSRAGCLKLPVGHMSARDFLMLNLTPFDITVQSNSSRIHVHAQSGVLIGGFHGVSAPKIGAIVLPSLGARGQRKSSKEIRRPSKDVQRDFLFFPPSADQCPSVGIERLQFSLDLQLTEQSEHYGLSNVLDTIRIDQGVGETRYRLSANTAMDQGNNGELRCLFSVKECGERFAAMATLVWSPPSELRGAPLRELKSYWQKQKALHRQSRQTPTENANMYEAVACSILPCTAAAQSSLAELLDFGPAETFVSHWWGSKVDSTLESLDKHSNGKESARVWICSIANNQRRITEELGGDIDQSSFSRALHSKHCQAMALMLDDDCETLKRIWCLYEVLCVILIRDNATEKSAAKIVEFDLCMPQGVLNHGNLHTEALEIGKIVANIDVAHAGCSNPRDKELIDAAIEKHLGGYANMNNRIRHAVDQTLQKTHDSYSSRLEGVRTNLNPNRWGTVRNAAMNHTLAPHESLAQERERNQQLELENARLQEEIRRLRDENGNLRKDLQSQFRLRDENARLKKKLQLQQSERRKAFT